MSEVGAGPERGPTLALLAQVVTGLGHGVIACEIHVEEVGCGVYEDISRACERGVNVVADAVEIILGRTGVTS